MIVAESRAPDVLLVKRVIRTLAKQGAYLTTTRAQKLFYLIERQHALETGTRCFNLDFRYDKYGMYSRTLDRIFKQLNPREDGLELRDITTERGSGLTIAWVGKLDDEPLPETVQRATAQVLSRWGYLSTRALIEKAKGTVPFVYAKRGEVLDWALLDDERCAEDEELSDAGRQRLERAESLVREGKYREFFDIDELIEDLFVAG